MGYIRAAPTKATPCAAEDLEGLCMSLRAGKVMWGRCVGQASTASPRISVKRRSSVLSRQETLGSPTTRPVPAGSKEYQPGHAQTEEPACSWLDGRTSRR